MKKYPALSSVELVDPIIINDCTGCVYLVEDGQCWLRLKMIYSECEEDGGYIYKLKQTKK